MRSFSFLSYATVVVVFLASTAMAQDAPYNQAPPYGQPAPNYEGAPDPQASMEQSNPGDPANDPQARVGRISLIEGTVSFHTADQNDWSYATLNYPVTSGTSFWTEPNARAEIQVGASALRLDNGTEVDVNELDDHSTTLTVQQGTINLHVGNLSDGVAYQVVTPDEKILVNQPGTYRIYAGTPQTPSEVAVLRGQAQIMDASSSVTIASGETAVVPPGNLASITVQETSPTSFDNWSLSRDNFEQPRRVAQYVSPQMTGYEDLENYGAWRTTSDYGPVWVPANVDENWQPYRYGHWVWVSPWGYTWVDDQPWGFAPFHYGRWAYIDHAWCWAPGRMVDHPVYAPALVAFIGGNNWHLSVGFGGFGGGGEPVGWFPLGPGEVYHPGYRVSPRYVQNVNVTSVTNINHIPNINNFYGRGNDNFANRRFSTVVPSEAFTGSRPIGPAVMHVSPQLLSRAPVRPSSAPVSIDARTETPLGHPRNDENGMTRAPTPPVKPTVAEGHPALMEHNNAPIAAPHVNEPARVAEPAHVAAPNPTRTEGAPSPEARAEGRPETPSATSGEHAPGPPIHQYGANTSPAAASTERHEAVQPEEKATESRSTETRAPTANEEHAPEASEYPQKNQPYTLHVPTAEEQRQMREREENQPVPERSPTVPVTHSEMESPAAHEQAPVHETIPQRPQQETRPLETPEQRASRANELRQQQPQPTHEVSVQRPAQTAPLTPSNQGWVRRPEAAPAQHPQPQQTHAEPQHAEPQHGEPQHNDNNGQGPQGH